MQKLFTLLTIFGLLASLLPATVAAEGIIGESIEAGDLLRSPSYSAVYYYGEDGFRYVFPNESTYFTWYSDFSQVNWVTDAWLGSLQIGGNVTYKPGSRLIKITSDPKTYAVDGDGHLHWVTTEAVAESMFGETWASMVDDVPDAFFGNYTISWDLTTVEDAEAFQMTLLSHESYTITDDKDLREPWEIYITADAYNPNDVPLATFLEENGNFVFRFVNNDDVVHTATADDGSWGTGTIQPGASYLVRLPNESTTHTYHCSYHPEITGSITTDAVEAW